MSNPTSNFGWQMPTPTDLVTDLPADFEVFGQAVDSTMADLKGGTSGQILSKNSNTDMDFTWITNDQGDITGITATSPLTGGGTSGDVTVGIQAASTSQSGAVQLTDSTSSTSTTTAATPNSVKSAYDLANAAIPKSTATAKGNVFTATASATPAVLVVGTNGQVLTADSTTATGLKWASASATSGPAFSAYRGTSAQSITTATFTKVQLNAETFDTGNCFDSTTNYRFTPTTAGYYQLNATIYGSGNTINRQMYMIYKNGSEYIRFTDTSVTTNGASSGGALVYFDGSTDYVELYVYLSGTVLLVNAGSTSTTFNGVWIRS